MGLGRGACWLAAALIALTTTLPAQSRTWSKNPLNLAQDYLAINDNRGGGEIIEVLWLASPMLPNTPATQAARNLLDKYIIVGVAHAHVAPEGTMTFDRPTTLAANAASGDALSLVNSTDMPPAVVGALATIQSLFTRSLGAFGQGVTWFAFDAGSTHACTKGGLAVDFAGEKYTYDTPVPGCM